MALLKEIQNPDSGVVTNYHKVNRVTVYNGGMNCEVDSYVSQEFRQNGASVETRTYYFDVTIEEEESMGARQLAYAKLKETPKWEGAEDC